MHTCLSFHLAAVGCRTLLRVKRRAVARDIGTRPEKALCPFHRRRARLPISLVGRSGSSSQRAHICRLVNHTSKTWKHRLDVVIAIVPTSGPQRVGVDESGSPCLQSRRISLELETWRSFAFLKAHCGAASGAIWLSDRLTLRRARIHDSLTNPSTTLFGAVDRVPVSPRSPSASVGWCWLRPVRVSLRRHNQRYCSVRG